MIWGIIPVILQNIVSLPNLEVSNKSIEVQKSAVKSKNDTVPIPAVFNR